MIECLEVKNIKSDKSSIGYKIDNLIKANLENWYGKEIFYGPKSSLKKANRAMIKSFQANKKRNEIVTEINKILDKGPNFHFRNYHNY